MEKKEKQASFRLLVQRDAREKQKCHGMRRLTELMQVQEWDLFLGALDFCGELVERTPSKVSCCSPWLEKLLRNLLGRAA